MKEPLPEKKIDGKDIRPLIFGVPDAKSPHESFAIYYDNWLQAIRDNRWKLVLPHQYRTMAGQMPGKDGIPGRYVQRQCPLALCDLENDIGETTDCSTAHRRLSSGCKPPLMRFVPILVKAITSDPAFDPQNESKTYEKISSSSETQSLDCKREPSGYVANENQISFYQTFFAFPLCSWCLRREKHLPRGTQRFHKRKNDNLFPFAMYVAVFLPQRISVMMSERKKIEKI